MLNFWHWFLNGNGYYSSGVTYLHNDWKLIGTMIFLNSIIILGYSFIVKHLWINRKINLKTTSRKAITQIMWIFIFGGVGEYLFRIIRIFYTVWPLYLLYIVALCILVWIYVFKTNKLKIVYEEMEKREIILEKVHEILTSVDIDPSVTLNEDIYRKLLQIRDAALATTASIDLLEKDYKERSSDDTPQVS